VTAGPWARWVLRAAMGVVLVASLRCDTDRSALPSPSWLRDQSDRQVVARTFPTQWKVGTRWSLETEVDVRGMRERTPRRAVAEYRVVTLEEGRALVDVAVDTGGIFENTRFAWDVVRLRVAALPDSEYLPPGTPTALSSVRGWLDVEEAGPPTCQSPLAAWGVPIVSRAVAGSALLDVLGEHWFDGIHQRAWVEDGVVRFEIRPAEADRATLFIAWRPGEPWWAKLECHQPGRATNPPIPEPWSVPRSARARLVAIDGVPIEPLPWEHPPADWMDPSGR